VSQQQHEDKPPFDSSVAHPARRYNFWLGGKDNFAADRESAAEIEKLFPGMRAGVRANRDALKRMTRFLARQGVRQFLDIGTGLPTAGNTHEVAQDVDPQCRVLYVDNDPLVMVHARALLTSTPEGVTDYIEADLRNPEDILLAPEFASTLDRDQPVALMLVAILHFIHGEGAAKPIVDTLMAALPSGSYFAATHFTLDLLSEQEKAKYHKLVDAGRIDTFARSTEEFTALFDGLELVEPGVVLASDWRPEPDTERPDPNLVSVLAAVGRKP
jgi:hypothetical protein